MKIVLPVQDSSRLYKDNPYTAPKFAIYIVDDINGKTLFTLDSIVENPLYNEYFTEDELQCNCSKDKQDSIIHRSKHTALLDTIQSCRYLLTTKCCVNTQEAMHDMGVRLYKLPPIINKIDIAIKNFLIGVTNARTV